MFNLQILKAVIIVSIIVFIIAVALYANPWVNRLYQKSTKIGIIKTWKNQGKFLFLHYLITLAEVIIFIWIFSIITIHPATEWFTAGIYFGLFLCFIRIVPRMLDMFMMVNYPRRLLIIELINGFIISMATSLLISYFLY
jgi:hypothetical protein